MRLRWSHAFVHVQNMQAMLDFYTDMLGFEITDQGKVGGRPVAFLSQVETDHHQLAFLERPRRGSAGGNPSQEDQPRPDSAPADPAHEKRPPAVSEPAPASRVGHFAFRAGSLTDVQSLHRRLQQDERVARVQPVTHGNAWSVYFADPEGNGIEVFCDSPWHLRQPQGGSWDPAMSEREVIEATRRAFADKDGFGPIEDYYRQRAAHLARREQK